MAERTTQGAATVRTDKDARTLTMERTFNAPRELVFRAWSEAEHLNNWWVPGPGWTSVNDVDFREGGRWHYCFRSPEGEESWGLAHYREIVTPERIVYVDTFADAEGNRLEGTPEMVISIDFADAGGKTTVTTTTQFASVEDFDATVGMGMVEGMGETWDRLAEYLPSIS